MTSRSSVEGQWSVSAVSRSVRVQRKFTKKKPEGSSGFIVTGHVLPCKAGRMPNGILKLGYKLACMKFIYLFLLRFSWRNSLLLLILLIRSSIWPCDKYSINSWNISSALHGLISHTTRACFGIYAGVTTMAVIWWSKNSFHSFPLSPIKAFTQGYHSSRHKYPFITRRRTKYFSSMLNIHQKAAEGCLTLSKKACWSQTRLNPQVRIWGSAGDCALYALC